MYFPLNSFDFSKISLARQYPYLKVRHHKKQDENFYVFKSKYKIYSQPN